MMTENEIREFVDDVTGGDQVTAVEAITARWLADRDEAADEAANEIHENARDSWNGG